MNELIASLDALLASLPPLARVASWALATSVISMGLYALISPQKKIVAIKQSQKSARQQLLHYDGAWDGLSKLIRQDLALSLKQVAYISIPFIISVAPIMLIFTALEALYTQPLTAMGPEWMQGFDFWYFVFLLVFSLAIKIKFKDSLMSDSSMQLSPMLDNMAERIAGNPELWIKLGNLESAILAIDSAAALQPPIYICGLARSGSTLLLEILAAHPDVATHRYQDFPFLFTPYWWNTLLALNPFRNRTKRERAHGDQMLVNGESPEAMEEILWMAFFSDLHSGDQNQLLDSVTSQPAFERFYKNHIQKLLLARKKSRYAAKGNYNITRMNYLQKLYRDARFVIPVREPVAHIASLMRQHQRFTEAGKADRRILTHMNLAGHFEFGLGRRIIHTGDSERVQAIQTAWDAGDEVRGWALYWDMLHRFIHAQLINLNDAALLVHHEVLCQKPDETLRTLLQHCRLREDAALIDHFSATIKAPFYYDSPLSPQDEQTIRSITGATAHLFGY